MYMMTLKEWNDMVSRLYNVYGCIYGFDCDVEGILPRNESELESAWFICPECGEPIYFCDYNEELNQRNECPVCAFEFEI